MVDSAYPDALPARHALHWYVLESVLGQGGFGITYLARDTNLDQTVAIKEFLPVDIATRRADTTVRPRSDEQAERYRWGLDRFIQEARTLARFDHPNIVRVLSVFEHNGTAYMVMRFEKGENFGSLLERKRTLPEPDLMRVLLPILDGLELVHGAGFIHRDIKPDNIHIRADGTPVLLDFGSARHALGNARTVTILVAPGYAPFEQYYASGEDQGPWTDIYSLGATCYRAIAGVAPMDAIARSKGILGSTRELLVPASAIGAGRYSAGLLRAVDHALAFAEKDRPASLAQWRAELVGGALPIPPSPPKETAPGRPEPPSMVRKALQGSIFLLVALVGGGIGAYFMMARTPSPPEATAPAKAPPAAPPPQVTVSTGTSKDDAKAPTNPVAPPPIVGPKPPKSPDPNPPTPRKPPTPPNPGPENVGLTIVNPAPPTAPPRDHEPEGDVARYNHFRALALRGDPDAALRLGELYESGRGVNRNPNWAYVWYSVAAVRGVAVAPARKAIVAAQLQAKEIEQADKLAASLAGQQR